MDYVVYDIEIVKGIRSRKEKGIEGIEYCKGWHDHANMGISVIGAFDSKESRYRVFCEDNFDEFFDLVSQRDLAVSFNGIGFDNKVLDLRITGKCMSELCEQYDILREIWISAKLNPDKFYWRTHGGYGLDDMAEANGLGSKSGHGALAPVQWQRGETGTVIDYCLQDVHLTRDLFDMCQCSPLVNPKGTAALLLRKVLDDEEE